MTACAGYISIAYLRLALYKSSKVYVHNPWIIVQSVNLRFEQQNLRMVQMRTLCITYTKVRIFYGNVNICDGVGCISGL